MKILRVTPGIWLDPWGNTHHVNQVMQIREVEQVPGEFIEYDYGYGPEHVAKCAVYFDTEGRKYQGIPPIDFCGRTYYVEINPRTKKEAAKAWYASVAVPAINKKGQPIDRNGVKL